MDSKRTKVTARPFIKKASPSTGLANTTARVSPALKSTSNEHHLRGLWAEKKAAEYFLNKHFKVLKTRWRTPYAEIDLLVESPRQEIFLVEVKTLSHFDFLQARVGRKQKERLLRALMFVQSKTRKSVILVLVFVDGHGDVLVIENF